MAKADDRLLITVRVKPDVHSAAKRAAKAGVFNHGDRQSLSALCAQAIEEFLGRAPAVDSSVSQPQPPAEQSNDPEV